jgi:hypothetical protein
MTFNNRVFYAIEQVAIKDNAAAPTSGVAPVNSREYPTGPLASGVDEIAGLWEVPRGVQSAGVSTTFNLEQVFQLGQVELYEYSERQPDIELTMSKAIDGSKPLFFMVTDPNGANNIVARANNFRVDVSMTIYPDTQFRATGKPQSVMTASGMYLSSATYTFPVDGFVSEDITLVGNDKVWGTLVNVSGITPGHDNSLVGGIGPGREPTVPFPSPGFNANIDPNAPEGIPSGVFGHDGNTSALVEGGAQELAGGTDRFGVITVGSGVQRREEVEIRRSVLPSDIPGIITFAASGIGAHYVNGGFGDQGPGTATTNTVQVGESNVDNIIEHIQNITVSADLSRDDIFEVGTKRPFAKVLEFPIEVTCTIEVITAQGDLVDASSAIDCGPDNTTESNTIIIRTCDGLQIDLGDANRLTGTEMGGGDAGGDNMTVTYNYQSFNVFNVTHDFYSPNHRVLVFETGNSRFNVGAPTFTRGSVIG